MKSELPSGAAKAASFIAAAAKAAMGVLSTGKLVAAPDARAERMAICEACSNFLASDGVLGARCIACGCFLKAKTALITQNCPEGKWPARKPI
jgi:hypothetical protein